MGSIRPHSSRRKPVTVWETSYHDDLGVFTKLFWYKKDAESYVLEQLNIQRQLIDPERPPFKALKPALQWMENSLPHWWSVGTTVINS